MTGIQVSESKLGKVPSAAKADSATSAGTAASAATAANAAHAASADNAAVPLRAECIGLLSDPAAYAIAIENFRPCRSMPPISKNVAGVSGGLSAVDLTASSLPLRRRASL